MISRILTIAILTIFSLGASAQTEKMDSIIYSKVEKLPEVKAYLKNAQHVFNKSDAGGNPRVATIIQNRPSGQFKYYWVQVGMMTDYRFTPELNFYVLPKTYEVRYLETTSDSVLTLKQWRKKKG